MGDVHVQDGLDLSEPFLFYFIFWQQHSGRRGSSSQFFALLAGIVSKRMEDGLGLHDPNPIRSDRILCNRVYFASSRVAS
jgi:hypothetical protein